MLIYRGEKRKLSVDMTASLNDAEGANAAVTIHRARGMADVSADLLVDTPEPVEFRVEDVEGVPHTFIDFWVDATAWTEIGRFRVRASCDTDNSEHAVEREVPLLIQ